MTKEQTGAWRILANLQLQCGHLVLRPPFCALSCSVLFLFPLHRELDSYCWPCLRIASKYRLLWNKRQWQKWVWFVTELFSSTAFLTAKMSRNWPTQLFDSCDFQRNYLPGLWHCHTLHYMRACIKLCWSCQIKLSTTDWLSPIQDMNQAHWETLPFWPWSVITLSGQKLPLGSSWVEQIQVWIKGHLAKSACSFR